MVEGDIHISEKYCADIQLIKNYSRIKFGFIAVILIYLK